MSITISMTLVIIVAEIITLKKNDSLSFILIVVRILVDMFESLVVFEYRAAGVGETLYSTVTGLKLGLYAKFIDKLAGCRGYPEL